MDEKQLAKLIRQNAAKAEQLTKARKSKKFDPTLAATQGEEDSEDDSSIERQQFFKEMKRREF
jgi:hypothetical protein